MVMTVFAIVCNGDGDGDDDNDDQREHRWMVEDVVDVHTMIVLVSLSMMKTLMMKWIMSMMLLLR